MTANIQAQMSVQLNATKQLVTSDPTATSPSLLMNLGAFSATWNNGSSPNALDAWSGHVALSSGAATIDLTNLTQLGLSTVVNATGNKIRAIMVQADSANANPISIGTGGTNGYSSIGVLSVLNANDIAIRTAVAAIAVDSTHKTLDLAGTGTQGCEVLIVFGS